MKARAQAREARGWEGAGSRAMAVPTAAKDCRRGAYELPSYVLALALARIAARRAERTTKDRVARTLANIPGQGVEGQSGNSLIASAPHVFTTNIATECKRGVGGTTAATHATAICRRKGQSR